MRVSQLMVVIVPLWIGASLATGWMLRRMSDCYRPFERRRVAR